MARFLSYFALSVVNRCLRRICRNFIDSRGPNLGFSVYNLTSSTARSSRACFCARVSFCSSFFLPSCSRRSRSRPSFFLRCFSLSARLLSLAPTLAAARRSFLSSQFDTKSSTTTAASANICANCGPAEPPLTALRKAINAPIAATMRWIVPQAACRPSIITITAPGAGTIIDTNFSTRMAINAAGIAALSAFQAILPIFARSMPPCSNICITMPPIPNTSTTLDLNHSLTEV